MHCLRKGRGAASRLRKHEITERTRIRNGYSSPPDWLPLAVDFEIGKRSLKPGYRIVRYPRAREPQLFQAREALEGIEVGDLGALETERIQAREVLEGLEVGDRGALEKEISQAR